MTPKQLAKIIANHAKWLRGEGGSRADLRGADLRGADLSSAYLSGADLSWAYLRGADLSGADLRGADLSGAYLRGVDLRGADLSWAYLSGADLSSAYLRGANLSGADLSGADLSEIQKDIQRVLLLALQEVTGLYKALIDGRIDGSCYSGECACLIGTIANERNCQITELGALIPDSSSAAEIFFIGIARGDTPQNNPISALVQGWVESFAKERGIVLPKRKVVWE